MLVFPLLGCILEPESGIAIILCGDSTVARYAGQNPVVGWGEALPKYLDEDVSIFNHAVPGSTAESFYENGMTNALMAHADIALVQFGHNYNDSIREAHFLDSITTAFQHEGTEVIFITPMRDREKKLIYPALDQAIRDAAGRHHLPLIPLDSLTGVAWSRAGENGVGAWLQDRIHLTANGADLVAGMVAQALCNMQPKVAR